MHRCSTNKTTAVCTERRTPETSGPISRKVSPSRFGFGLAVHPHDGDTIYVCPEESDQNRITPDGALRIFRSRDRGDSWEALTNGLPQDNAYQLVLRAAMATDSLDPVGVYVGTQGGQVFASRDQGDHWEVLFPWLPPVYSVTTAIVEV